MTTLEAALRKAWNARPFHRFGTCSRCGEQKHTTGKRRNSMLCIVCFDATGAK
jgi:formylmethanofuran dehydrogenase subunit E